jgi:hypothetical protein
VLAGALVFVCWAGLAEAQLSQLVSPGPLAKAHASLEGVANCQKCHEPGKKIGTDRCLACHKPIAERIATKTGVHRNAASGCVSCHIDHAGTDTDLRHFDQTKFDHARDTSYPLDGRHAAVSRKCASCHKTRSYLTAQTRCISCHADVHKPTLGAVCETCHQVSADFRAATTAFDHSKSAYPLDGAHRTVACAKCHVNKVYKGVRFASCTDCHRTPHKQALSGACTTCHTTTETWKTQKFEHAKTTYPLRGKHAEATCAACHAKPPMQAKLDASRCATCHVDVHRGEFKQDCNACHNESSFKRQEFDHPAATKTRFALTGKHATATCVACHKGAAPAAADGRARRALPGRAGQTVVNAVDFRGLSTTCVSCHKDVHRDELGPLCETCHTADTFNVKTYAHQRNKDFFGGQHAAVGCPTCHAPKSAGAAAPATAAASAGGAKLEGWRFKNLPIACATCHKDVHLGQVGTACETCHPIEAKFASVSFSHGKSSFALTGKHADVVCAKCHKTETGTFPAGRGTAVRLKGVSSACASCHQDKHLGQLGPKCETCHSTTAFTVASYKHIEKPGFFVGKHATTKCQDCHKEKEDTYPAGKGKAVRYTGFGTTCATCHDDRHAGALGKNCATCHEPTRWNVVSRAFHKAGAFPLEGRHLTVECAACHTNGVIQGTPKECFDCHWARRQDDRYQTRLGKDCSQCHRPTAWTAVKWDHAASTGVPLSPAHRTIGCEGCHRSQVFADASLSCASCHNQDYQRATSPNHVNAGFPTNCEACHLPTQTSWQQASLSHTTFPLVGVHTTAPCAGCHKNSVYQGTPRDCYPCHQPAYQQTQSPNHAAAGFATSCDACHKATDPSWLLATTNHSTFALVGVHATQACTTCHKNGLYRGTPRDCYTCHQADYSRTTSPKHAAAGYSTACDSCHKATDPTWSSGTSTGHNSFPLVGLHATQACTACHKNGVYLGTPRDCYSCHQANYSQTTSPNHAAAGYSTACDSCHRASDPTWLTANATHSTFPLVGVHAVQACTACHKNGVYLGTPRDCFTCHQANYNQTTSPNHAAAGYSTACDSCHRASDPTWLTATVNHTTYPLVGVHATQACTACHKNGVYRGTPRDCFTCHQANYNQTTNPNHAAAGYSAACDSCHRATDPTWLTATVNHTSFPLVGVHATQACTACHKNGVYLGTPRDCFSCHQTNYNQTTNPNHAAAGFPTTCDQCHKATDASWTLGTFAHTAFPITGRHAAACSSCHTSPTNYKVFTCLTCHDRASTDSHHQGRSGYVYDSQACYTCHPRGSAG